MARARTPCSAGSRITGCSSSGAGSGACARWCCWATTASPRSSTRSPTCHRLTATRCSMLERDADIVIIGSGAGGGTVASELAPLCAHGARIVVLEAGPKLRPEEYTGREVEMAGRLYTDEGGFLTEDRSMSIAFGRAYGGSTVVYTGTSLTITEPTVARWAVPGLEHADLLTRSHKYLAENHVHLLPDADINDNNRLFAEGCRRLGYRVEQFPLNLNGCRGAGLCNLGCPNGSKM